MENVIDDDAIDGSLSGSIRTFDEYIEKTMGLGTPQFGILGRAVLRNSTKEEHSVTILLDAHNTRKNGIDVNCVYSHSASSISTLPFKSSAFVEDC